MAITYLPQAGSITEKNVANYWHGAMAGQAYLTGIVNLRGNLSSSGLSVYLNPVAYNTAATLNGYVIVPGNSTDLAVTLPANSLSYVYLVIDMAGGGTNTIGQRLVYYGSPVYVPNGALLAAVITDATTVITKTMLTPTRHANMQAYYYEMGSWLGDVLISTDKSALVERTSTDTTGELVKQFCVEYAGVYKFSCELKNQSLATTTCYVYAASTGDTHGTSTAQLTFTDTNSTYTTNTGSLALAEGDIVSIYLKTSNATYAAYIDTCWLEWYYGVPLAPAFHIE